MSADSIPLDPFAATALSRDDAEAYTDRLQLPRSVLNEQPSCDLLKRVMVAQLEEIPKETSPLHVPEADWEGPNKPIVLGSCHSKMPESLLSFDRTIRQCKGAFCFSINSTFAAYLRTLNFTVSELVGRTFKSLGNDPLTHADGWKWGTFTHQLLVASWEGAGERYLVDGAWGPWSCSVPIKLENGAQTLGLNDYEGFKVVYEPLQLSAHQTQPIDNIPGWTLYRFVPPPNTPLSLPLPSSPSPNEGFWTPQFHFHPISLGTLDFRLFHHFSASHECASFTFYWLVTKLIPGTGGARRSMLYQDKEGLPRRAKVYTTGGTDGRGSLEGRDVEWVEMETQPMREYLKKEFGFGFP
ncbi:hypothetical protein JCM8547_000892 [Rhodosporidiobolus lusitaniae]